MPNGVVFLPSYHEAIRELPDRDRLNAYDAVVSYGLYGEIIEMTPTVKMMFSLMKPNIDSSKNRYRASKENGNKPPKPGSKPRGRPRKNQSENQTENQSINQDMDIDFEKDLDSDSERDSDCDYKRERNRTLSCEKSECVPPSVEEVRQFCIETETWIDPQRFVDAMNARNWMHGKTKITDWRSEAKAWASLEATPERQQFRLTGMYGSNAQEKRYNIHYDVGGD